MSRETSTALTCNVHQDTSWEKTKSTHRCAHNEDRLVSNKVRMPILVGMRNSVREFGCPSFQSGDTRHVRRAEPPTRYHNSVKMLRRIDQ